MMNDLEMFRLFYPHGTRSDWRRFYRVQRRWRSVMGPSLDLDAAVRAIRAFDDFGAALEQIRRLSQPSRAAAESLRRLGVLLPRVPWRQRLWGRLTDWLAPRD